MNTKILYFVLFSVIVIASFSCKKRNNVSQEVPTENQPTDLNLSTAEKTRLLYYKDNYYEEQPIAILLAGFTGLKGKLKSVFVYDSEKQIRKHHTFNKAGYLLSDTFFDAALPPLDGMYIVFSNTDITYDDNNFVIIDVKKSNNAMDSICYVVKDSENVVIEKWYLDIGIDKWNPDFKNAYTYQSKGKIATDTSFSYNENTKTWEPKSVTVNEYQDGNIITSTGSRLATVSLVNRYKETYEQYDNQGNPKIVKVWLTQDGGQTWNLQNTYYFEITYW